MKTKKSLLIVSLMLLLSAVALSLLAFKPAAPLKEKSCCSKPLSVKQGCVFKTFFGEEDSDSAFIYKTPVKVKNTMNEGLEWIMQSQLNNGGWGAGTHARQDITDPLSVKADPATTAMVAMGVLRCENTLRNGKYSTHLLKALNYLLAEVKNSDNESLNITSLTGTQPQAKLGQNIDVILTSQFLTNVVDYINDPALKNRVTRCNQKCINKIQRAQNENGSMSGQGWAGVLQSSFATNALETARDKGLKVDDKALDRSIDYHKNNIDENNNVRTEEAAGVLLYSLSSSTRASAKEARVAREKISEAKKLGKVQSDAPVTVENLKAAGMNESDAMKYSSAYRINSVAKQQAQTNSVMNGFGSNGGEEFMSYLQTGEGLIMNKDIEWKKWYDNISGKLIQIQNNDGSWSGHHCITSPVFCTATSLLILSVNNDVDKLMALGSK